MDRYYLIRMENLEVSWEPEIEQSLERLRSYLVSQEQYECDYAAFCGYLPDQSSPGGLTPIQDYLRRLILLAASSGLSIVTVRPDYFFQMGDHARSKLSRSLNTIMLSDSLNAEQTFIALAKELARGLVLDSESHEIQNEVITILSAFVLGEILGRMRLASKILDEGFAIGKSNEQGRQKIRKLLLESIPGPPQVQRLQDSLVRAQNYLRADLSRRPVAGLPGSCYLVGPYPAFPSLENWPSPKILQGQTN